MPKGLNSETLKRKKWVITRTSDRMAKSKFLSTSDPHFDPRTALAECTELLKRGELTAGHLQAVANRLDGVPRQRQDLLYVWTLFSSLTSPVNGMALIENGQIQPCPENPDHWLYKCVLDAMNDGWRIISFPDLSYVTDNNETYGLGCQFILEKIKVTGQL